MTHIEKIKHDREKWLQALETSTAKQGQGRLGDATQGFCCLGLGCHTIGIRHLAMAGTSMEFTSRVGLRSDIGCPDDEIKPSLVELNDEEGLTFAQIARILRENMDQYFLKGTL